MRVAFGTARCCYPTDPACVAAATTRDTFVVRRKF
jgi:hypothetical protein